MRAALRISFRSVRRHPLRSVVIVLLVAVPVATLLVAQLVAAGNADRRTREVFARFGNDQVLVRSASVNMSDRLDPAAVRTELRLPNAAVSNVARSGMAAVVDSNGRATQIPWMEMSAAGLPTLPVRLVDGRWPTAAGEVVVLEAAGSAPELPRRPALPDVAVNVVGHARPQTNSASPIRDLVARFADTPPFAFLAAPDTFVFDAVRAGLDQPRTELRIHNIGEPQLSRLREQFPADSPTTALSSGTTLVETRAPVEDQTAADMTWISLFGFFWVALLAASGLAIGARRRRRELGLLAANGATPFQLGGAVTADGVTLGIIGSIVGTVIGLAVAVVIQRNGVGFFWNGRSIGRVPIAFTGWALATPLIGWASLTLAGAFAGRGIRRQSTLDLLAGRAPRYGKAPNWLVVGLALSGIAIGGATLLRRTDQSSPPALVNAMIAIAGLLGLTCVAVGAVRLAAPLTRARGLTLRLAGRDLHRFGARTAATVAALSITLAGTTMLAVLERRDANQRDQMLSAELREQMPTATPLRTTVAVRSPTARIVDGRFTAESFSPADAIAAAEQLRAAGLTARLTETVAARSCVGNAAELAETTEQYGMPFDADGCRPTVIRRVDETAAATMPPDVQRSLDQQGMVLVSEYGDPGSIPGGRSLRDPSVRIGASVVPTGVVAPFALGEDWFAFDPTGSTVIANAAAWARLGLAADSADVQVSASLPIDEVQRRLTSLGFESGWSSTSWYDSSGPSSRVTKLLVGAAIALFTLLVLALSLVLVRMESRDEETVLRAQGGTRFLVARINGTRAALATVLAAVPAVILASLFMLAADRRAPLPHPVSVVLIVVGMPLLAGLVFGLGGLRTMRANRTVV
jgi:ABC-type lipoprotein release transport system permease subunit